MVFPPLQQRIQQLPAERSGKEAREPKRKKSRRQEGSGEGEARDGRGLAGCATLAEGETEAWLLETPLRVGVMPRS